MAFAAFYSGALFGRVSYGARGNAIYNASISDNFILNDSLLSQTVISAALVEDITGCDVFGLLALYNQAIAEQASAFYINHKRIIDDSIEAEENRTGILIQENRAGETVTYHSPAATLDSRNLLIDASRKTQVESENRVF